MTKIISFSKKKSIFASEPNIDFLNNEIGQLENDGWKVRSISTNTNLFGSITSYTVLFDKINS